MTQHDTKKVMIVSSDFPPINRIASVRAGMFAKFLPEFGWTPQVVPGDWGYDPDSSQIDSGFLPETQPYIVGRTDARPRWGASKIVKVLTGREKSGGESFFYNLSQILKDKLKPECDPYRYYSNLLSTLPKLIDQFQPDILFATSPKRGTHAAVSRVAKSKGLPWVAEFRDIFEQEFESKFARSIIGSRERKILQNASAVIGVTPAMVDTLATRYRGDIHMIPNGFSPESFPSPPPSLDKKLTITYTGTLSKELLRHRNPAMLFEALDMLANDPDIDLNDFQVNFVGRCDEEAILNCIRHTQSKSVVHFPGMVRRSEATEYQQKSQLLLQLAHGNQKGILTGKVFEYLGAGRPILSFPQDFDCLDELLHRTKSGFTCNDSKAIADCLSKVYPQWKQNGAIKYDGNSSEIGKYHRRSQAGQLAEVLNSALNGLPSKNSDKGAN